MSQVSDRPAYGELAAYLGVCVFQNSDRGKDLQTTCQPRFASQSLSLPTYFRETDEGVGSNLRPHIDGRMKCLSKQMGQLPFDGQHTQATHDAIFIDARIGIVSTGAHSVDVQLSDSSPMIMAE